jgi:MFS family permease
MLDVRFFKNRRFSAANLAITLTFFAMFGSMFVLTQFMQYVLGFSPLQAGVRSVPLALMLMVVAPLSTKFVERIGTKLVVASGLGIVAVGLAVAATATPSQGYLPRVFPAQLLLGLGIALAMAPATESIMGSLPKEKAGVGSAMNDTTRQVGGAMGVAIIGSVFSSRYAPAVTANLARLGLPLPAAALSASRDSIGGAIAVASRAGGNPKVVDTPVGLQIQEAARQAFASSMGRGLLVSAAIALMGALVALVFLPARAEDPSVDPSTDLETVDASIAELLDVPTPGLAAAPGAVTGTDELEPVGAP